MSTDLPILFSSPMVRAILGGSKRMTRRVILPGQDPDAMSVDVRAFSLRTRYQVGRSMWVRERMRVAAVDYHANKPVRVQVRYEADQRRSDWITYPARLAAPKIGKCLAYGGHREASRIDLRVTAHRVERLHEITEADARAEGVEPAACEPGCDCAEWSGQRYRRGFERLWDAINGKRAPWSSNPWVEVVTFERTRP